MTRSARLEFPVSGRRHLMQQCNMRRRLRALSDQHQGRQHLLAVQSCSLCGVPVSVLVPARLWHNTNSSMKSMLVTMVVNEACYSSNEVVGACKCQLPPQHLMKHDSRWRCRKGTNTIQDAPRMITEWQLLQGDGTHGVEVEGHRAAVEERGAAARPRRP